LSRRRLDGASLDHLDRGGQMEHAADRPDAGLATPQVRQVDASQPLVWLKRGWSDLKRSAGPSLGYGAWVAAFGFALLMVAWRYTYLVPELTGGFLLVALSRSLMRCRCRSSGAKVDGSAAVFAWRHP
jgi:uncharacterized membrane protein